MAPTERTRVAHGPRSRPNFRPMTHPRQIVAFGGGGFSMEAGNPLLDDYVLGLAATGWERQPPFSSNPAVRRNRSATIAGS